MFVKRAELPGQIVNCLSPVPDAEMLGSLTGNGAPMMASRRVARLPARLDVLRFSARNIDEWLESAAAATAAIRVQAYGSRLTLRRGREA